MQATDTGWSANTAVDKTTPPLSLGKLIVTLFKLRVVSLLLLSAYGGMALGMVAGGTATMGNFLLLTVTGTLSAAGASAINQYLERDRDTYMKRTAARPLVTGQIAHPQRVLWLALGMVVGSSALAGGMGNWSLAFWLLAGAVIYVGVYTIWLKPRTVLNIVIGGAAGSCAVVSGGAAVGATWAPAVWVLAALIFVWTPVHFWALALAYREDYARADYPMLPTQVSAQTAAGWTALHTVLTAVGALALGFVPAVDWPYLAVITVATWPLLTRTRDLLRRPDKKTGLSLFIYTNIYLSIILGMVILATLWR